MNKARRWAWIVSIVAGTGAALVLAFVLALAVQDGGVFERHFVWMFWLNVAIAVLLTLVIGIAFARLAVRVQRGKFGSRLLMKLAGIFALVGLLPGLVIYTVSYQFVTRSIEAWFDVKVAGALDAGLALGKSTLDAQAAELAAKTRVAAERLADTTGTALPLVLERLREQLGAREVSLLGPTGAVLYAAADTAGSVAPERPGAQMLRLARQGQSASQVEGLDDESGGDARVRALARLPSSAVQLAPADERYLMVVERVPRALAANALAVQAAYAEYQQRALARDSLRRTYIGTLTLALILAVFGSLLLAVVMGNQIARPLLMLADGVRQVAAGDLKPKPVFASGDELGGLTQSFAEMTSQLADARAQVQRGVAQLEGARTRLQTILDTLTAGVIVCDQRGLIDTLNPGATRILRLPLAAWRGRAIADVPGLEPLAAEVEQRFELMITSPEAAERDHWQSSMDLELARGSAAERETLTLLLRGALLPGEARLIVFDDITEVVSAQRLAAWSEVARRLAHEIRNPLTPIQLSAERLRMKLEPRLEGTDQALLLRSTDTIVAQVQAMQRLVNEFREFGRLPAARLEPLDLNALVGEVLSLYGQALDAGLLVAKLGDALPRILGDPTQLRQVVHNLVQNGLDAVAERSRGEVIVATGAVRAEQGALRAVRLTVRDNGPGFAEKVLKRAFEPYVTTKPKGTGLGLAVVKKIADEHGARLTVANLHEHDDPAARVVGARVSISFSNLAPAAAGAAAPAPETKQAH